MAARRSAWRAAQGWIDPARLVFLDESGVNTKMTRLYGRCPVGQRLLSRAPFGHWKTMTFIAGLRRSGLVAPWVLEGAMDGDAFKTYTAEILAPTLAPGDIVVMDNLPAHKVAGIAETFAKKKAQLFYLPPYSPDMNPIEMAFSKLKTALRAEPARTIDTLWRRIGIILDSFTAKDCANYFQAAGYQHSM